MGTEVGGAKSGSKEGKKEEDVVSKRKRSRRYYYYYYYLLEFLSRPGATRTLVPLVLPMPPVGSRINWNGTCFFPPFKEITILQQKR